MPLWLAVMKAVPGMSGNNSTCIWPRSLCASSTTLTSKRRSCGGKE